MPHKTGALTYEKNYGEHSLLSNRVLPDDKCAKESVITPQINTPVLSKFLMKNGMKFKAVSSTHDNEEVYFNTDSTNLHA